MSFDKFKFSRLRPFLFPVAIISGAYIRLRNWLFDKTIIKSASFNFPVICVGNLSVGGTGKSPMVEYLIGLLQPSYRLAILSRGYKRKTKGFLLATKNTTALEIGDEPMQFHRKFPKVTVAVCEERAAGIPMILHDKPETDVIILDDAFQHRHVSAGLNIVLMQFDEPFWDDHYLPAGNLRDQAESLARAQMVVVTKCPDTPDEETVTRYTNSINKYSSSPIFFAKLSYGLPYLLQDSGNTMNPDPDSAVLLVTGIANPQPLQQLLQKRVSHYADIVYNDHHIFTIDDLRHIQKQFERMPPAKRLLLTTEKDAVRLEKFGDALQALPIYVVPVSHQILFNREQDFTQLVGDFVNSFTTAAKAVH